MKQLILGGARSGKSALAQTIAVQQADARKERGLDTQLVYLATCDNSAADNEMQTRIARHKAERDERWTLVEADADLATTLKSIAKENTIILVDCLTLWLTRCLLVDEDLSKALIFWQQQKEALLAAVKSLPGEILFISNEVGQGVIPMGALSRTFVDEAGFLHQALASQCDRVVFTVAGLPMVLKG